MQEAAGELLVSRLLVRADLPYCAMRIDLASAKPDGHPSEPATPAHPSVQVLRVEQLAELAQSLAADGLLIRSEGSALNRSGLRQALRYLRARYAGWIALHMRAPDPADLRSILAEPLVDFVDLQLSWVDVDPEASVPAIRLAPSCQQLQAILCAATCPCVMRFTSPADGEIFHKISSVFDAFVRNSPDPVAVQLCEPDLQPATPALPFEALEFVACRPASMFDDANPAWLNLQPQPRPQANAKYTESQRGETLRF